MTGNLSEGLVDVAKRPGFAWALCSRLLIGAGDVAVPTQFR
jgi:hypothetical protein